MKCKNTEFVLNDNDKAEVERRLKSLLEICQIHHVPMFATVAVENTDTGTVYNNIVYGGKAHNINLNDDQIQRHILVANDFRVVPMRDAVEIDMNELVEMSYERGE